MPKLEVLEDDIGRHLAEAERSGELRLSPSYGKPLAEDVGWDSTPVEFRMPFKILKDAGMAPPEVALFHERARLREALGAQSDPVARDAVRRRLSELEQRIALRLEGLRHNGAL